MAPLLSEYNGQNSTMAGRNKGICHSCRRPGHMLSDCPGKRRCPNCGQGYVKWMEVEKLTDNKGRLFHCCTRDVCRFFDWNKSPPDVAYPLQDEGQSSGITNGSESIDDLSRMLETCANIADKKDIEISVNIIKMRKGK